MTANWIQKKKAELNGIKQLERALMNRSDIRAALNRYVASLNLQGQINAGKITEEQAITLFKRAIQQFSYTLNKEINQRFTPETFDQNDLSNPLNMQHVINNPDSLPDSFISIQINDIAASTILAINEESLVNEQAQNQLQMIDQQTIQQAEIQTQNSPVPKPESHEKEALLVTAVLGASLEKDAIEHAFEKYVGKDLKNELGKFDEPKELKDELNKIESSFKIPTLKPEPPKADDK